MNFVKVLGSSGSKTKNSGTTCFQVYKDILVDAGNILHPLEEYALHINHIFLTHSHSDHIIDLPFLIETFFEQRTTPLKIYGSSETINSLKKHIFNNEIWPDFSQINLLNSEKKALEFIIIKPNEIIKIHDFKIKAIFANHIEGSYGFTISRANETYVISGDTYFNEKLIEELNSNKEIKILICECSFPNNMENLAFDSKHLTPKLLSNMLKKINRDDLKVYIYHIKPSFSKTMIKEIEELGILKNEGTILKDNDILDIENASIELNSIDDSKFQRIMDINIELSSQRNRSKLFEMIVRFARDITHCEGGTLYIKSKDKNTKEDVLKFKIIQNSKLGIFLDDKKDLSDWESLKLFENGKENKSLVAAVSAIENKIVNIENVYENNEYNFSGTKKFDKKSGYFSKSMLVIPLINHEDDVIGVLQLINKKDVFNKKIKAFSLEDEVIVKALASQAAMALTNTHLIDSLEEFINSFVSTIGHAIDAKSKHTMNHVDKVVKLARLIAKAIHEDKSLYKDIKYSDNDFKQIELAAFMHDVGKISMPESIIDKSTKLETIVDRINIVKVKFEVLKKELKILFLEKKIDENSYLEKIKNLDEDFEFLAKANIGGEFMSDEDIKRVQKIGKYSYETNGEKTTLLSEEEVESLSIRKGTLTNEEKRIMNSHAQLSLDMLSTLPFPKKYNKVFDIAVNHHEKLNGKGYPRGLTEENLELEHRIMILADIFEALTACDRPYKKGKKLSEVFKILSYMVKDGEIDGELLEFFHKNKVLEEYANNELKPYQVDESKLLF